MEKSQKKFNFREKISGLANGYLELLKRYPVTTISALLLSIFGAIYIDCESSELENFLSKGMLYFGCFLPGAFLSELLFEKKLSVRYLLSIILQAITALIYAYSIVDGLDSIVMKHYCTYSFITLLVSEAAVILYVLIRRSALSIEKYCVGAIVELFKVCVVQLALMIGIALIGVMFNILFAADTVFFFRAEIVLLGIVLAPLIISALTNEYSEPIKFVRFLILYILMPMLLVASVIIYIYILSILVNLEIPKNQAYGVVAYLFCIGVPIWTIAQSFEKSINAKIGRWMPFVFVVPYILQCICIAIRISNYGFTCSRYFGLMAVILEAIYLALYFVKFFKKKDCIAYAILAIPFMAFIGLLAPGFNCFSVSVRSQAKIFNEIYTRKDNLSEDEALRLYDVYNDIYRTGYQGKKYLEDNYPEGIEEDITAIRKVTRSESASINNISFKKSRTRYVYDIAGYTTFYRNFYSGQYVEINDLTAIHLATSAGGYEGFEIELDFSDYVQQILNHIESGNIELCSDDTGSLQSTCYKYDYDYIENEAPVFDQGRYRVYVNSMEITYDSSQRKIIEFSVSCDILEKDDLDENEETVWKK